MCALVFTSIPRSKVRQILHSGAALDRLFPAGRHLPVEGVASSIMAHFRCKGKSLLP
jgi:hypothetical protein